MHLWEQNARTPYRMLLTVAGLSLALLAVFALVRYGGSRSKAPSPGKNSTPTNAPPTRFSRVVVEGLRMNAQTSDSPFPLLTLGTCRVAKPRVGGFRLGIGEVLELDRLELNLPLDPPTAATSAESGPTSAVPAAAPTVDALLTRSLDVSSFRRMARIVGPVSSATINNLRIALIQDTNQVVILTAASAVLASRSELTLRKCVFLDGNLRSHEAAKARLTNAQGWHLTAENGPTVEIEALAAALRQRAAISR